MKNKVDKNNYFKLHDNCTSFNPKFLLIILLFETNNYIGFKIHNF